MKYKQLTKDQRCQIWVLKSIGKQSQKEIAILVGTSPGTISRELKRNSGSRGYRHGQAHAKAMERRGNASACPKRMTPQVIRLVERYLRERWSPEQIAGVLSKNGIPISYESIYGQTKNPTVTCIRIFDVEGKSITTEVLKRQEEAVFLIGLALNVVRQS